VTAFSVGPGVDVTVSERGWFAPPFTGCRFAVEAEIAAFVGYTGLPLMRRPKGVDNFVLALQQAGDKTPWNGSTLAQGQKALRVLLPDAPILFGTLSDDEIVAAVAKNAKVGFAVRMSKMPHDLRRFCGYGYNGGHYMAFGPSGLSDPMFKPAGQAHPLDVDYDEFKGAIERDAHGNPIVVVGFFNAAYYRQQLATAEAAKAPLDAQIADLTAKIAAQTI
jgi:hypothetical protein